MLTPSNPTPIPLISLSPFVSASEPSARLVTAKALTAACRSVGFVYLTDHGVPREKVAEAFAWSKRLFDLRKEDKMKALHPPGSAVHRGYSFPGLEKVSDVIQEEVGEKGMREVRSVPDFKVCTGRSVPGMDVMEGGRMGLRDDRRAMKSAARSMPRSLTSGFRRMSSLD